MTRRQSRLTALCVLAIVHIRAPFFGVYLPIAPTNDGNIKFTNDELYTPEDRSS